ncbi:unnamed protein product [Urochloa humidicola]
MAKARSVTARFTTEVAPAKVLSITRRRTAAPVRRLDPIAEDDREQLAYWSESSYHHQQQLQGSRQVFVGRAWPARPPDE